MRHPDLGRKLLDGIAEVLKGSAVIERSPVMEGRMMSMIVSRAPGWEPPKKQAAPAEKTHSVATAERKATAAARPAGSTAPPKPALVAESSEAANIQSES
jgi:translation initiation factor IF-3